jgi:hypothetical protein
MMDKPDPALRGSNDRSLKRGPGVANSDQEYQPPRESLNAKSLYPEKGKFVNAYSPLFIVLLLSKAEII